MDGIARHALDASEVETVATEDDVLIAHGFFAVDSVDERKAHLRGFVITAGLFDVRHVAKVVLHSPERTGPKRTIDDKQCALPKDEFPLLAHC